MLGWKPTDFSQATLRDYMAAIDGFNDLHASGSEGGMTQDRFQELKAQYGR
ncbi:hypothetical protein [Cohaesibacter celericrescens]|uniref:hypothetical protein n=1 Tax=Cohaesibacter celericrescens TaxID=2067669 RepID=UPI0015E0B562|nr:hypothetical protein [Cohaesibacter celericrescens]